MKKLIFIMLLSLTACKKESGHTLLQQPIVTASSEPLKLGDTVKWVSSLNPTPNNKMVIVASYYNDPSKPISFTVLDGTTYHTDVAANFILWK